MISVFVKLDCGCCTDELKFASVEAAEAAFSKAGLGNSVDITDDAGVCHTKLDTFYGFSLTEEEQEERHLSYLFDEVTAPSASGRD